MNKKYDVIVIGGGAAGMSAALSAYRNGATSTLLIERDRECGGILNQCIHNGFGLHHYKEELTGPMYAERLSDELKKTPVEVKYETTVLKISAGKEVHYLNADEGYTIVSSKAIILSCGSRERTQYQIDLPGKRIPGIMTAGLAQHYINVEGYHVGKKVFILGSGDIGLIMARRLTLEGAKVVGVAEIMPYSNGLNRNIMQCLHDFNIPLYLSHTVTQVIGEKRLEKIIISKVDENFKVIEGTDQAFDVDTLLLSIGLIPENKLLTDLNVMMNPKTNGPIVDETYQTSIDGIYSCGNSLHIHDLVDYASDEGDQAGRYAALSIKRKDYIRVNTGTAIRYCVPNLIHQNFTEEITIKFRVSRPISKGVIRIKQGDKVLKVIKKTHLVPSEMNQIKLRISDLTSDDLYIELKEEEDYE